jgi:microcystin-dependent protein
MGQGIRQEKRMADPYVGEIRMFAGTFNPSGWQFCSGQLLSISQNATLFNLIGTTYGGDGQNTFALPDLRGRTPIHTGTGGGQSYAQGQQGGVENVTLTTQQLPTHSHPFTVQGGGGGSLTPGGNFLSGSTLGQYAPTPATGVSANMLAATGGSQPHDNLMPYLTVNFIISLFGVYPSQN